MNNNAPKIDKTKSSIPVTSIQGENTKINLPTTKVSKNDIVFSFEYFKCQSLKNKIFNNCFENMWHYGEWSILALKKIQSFSSMTRDELKQGGDSTRCHDVKGKDLDKLLKVLVMMGIKIDEQWDVSNFYELSFGTGKGRMFGYFIDNVYYIFLFDPNHLIYANLSKGAKLDLLYKNFDPWHY